MKKYIQVFFLLICFSSATGQIPYSLDTSLQSILNTMRNYYNVKGISSAVIIPGMGTWQGVSGFSHGTDSIKPDMRFSIGSNTKPYTAALMLKLQEIGVISLNDSIHNWLPSYTNINPNVTIRQLLNMTSGIYNYTSHPNFLDSMNYDYNRYWTPDEILQKMVIGSPSTPGTYNYSNTNYLLAGMIIKAATGTAPSDSLRKLILMPGNLNSTYFAGEELVSGTIVHSWDTINPSRHWSNFNGDISALPDTSFDSWTWTAGCIKSTAENLARFYQQLFNGSLLSPSSVNEMLTFLPASGNEDFGLGIRRSSPAYIPGSTIWYKEGYSDNISCAQIDSATKVSVSVLINQSYDSSPSFKVCGFSKALLRTVLDTLKVYAYVNDVNYKQRNIVESYPNPFSEFTTLTFENTENEKCTLTVYNVTGQKIRVIENITTGKVKFMRANLHPGLYFFQLKNDKKILATGKWVID